MHMLVHPAVGLRRKRRPGRADGPQRGQLHLPARRDPRLHASGEKRRAGTEEGGAFACREAPQRAHVGVAGVPVELQDRAAGRERGDPQVPHDPVRRREPEEAVRLADVQVQGVRLEIFQDGAAVAVDDGLRHPAGARGVDDPEGMVERDLGERRGRGRLDRLGESRHPGGAPSGAGERARRGSRVEVGDQDHRLDAGQLPEQLVDRLQPIERLAAVPVAVHHDQYFWLDLPEAVEHADRPHVGRGAGPHGADARRREHRDHRLRHVRRGGRPSG